MNAPFAAPAVPPYKHTPLFPLGKDETPYRKISADGVRVDTERSQAFERLPTQEPAAQRIAGFTRAFQQQYSCARVRQPDRRRRPGGSGADDDCVGHRTRSTQSR